MNLFDNINHIYILVEPCDLRKGIDGYASIPDSPEEWLDEFSAFSIYQVLPKIIELWGLNVQADV